MPIPLPVGTRLLYIGPQKTGTSSLQEAFHGSRERLAELGVHYAGEQRQQRIAAGVVVTGGALPGNTEDTLEFWPRLVEEVAASTSPRVIVSAEMFASARDPQVREIVTAFNPGAHVVVTLRPVVRILPSQWQQFVQNGVTASYGEWLDRVLNAPVERRPEMLFWRRHQHDDLVRRWADVVGPEHVTVIALDENDRGLSFRSFEQLLDLPVGTLVPGTRSNRSLTMTEIEVVRALNVRYKREGWPKGIYQKVVREAFHNGLKSRTPDPSEPAIETPRWAQVRADEIAEQIIGGLTELTAAGVQVMGDLTTLRLEPAGPDEVPAVAAVSTDLVGDVTAELIRSSVIDPKDAVRRLVYDDVDLRGASLGEVAAELRGRVRRQIRRRFR